MIQYFVTEPSQGDSRSADLQLCMNGPFKKFYWAIFAKIVNRIMPNIIQFTTYLRIYVITMSLITMQLARGRG